MCCLWFSWSSCVFFCCVLLQTTGTRITNCASGSVEVVADTADFSLTCVEYTGTVQWRYTVSTQPDVFNVIGSCGSSCQLDREGLSRSFSLTQLSATSSRLGLKSTVTSASLPVFTYFCADSSCSVSIVVHAELSTPTLTVTTPATGSGWTVRGNVNITRIFSSAGQYSCVWEEKRPGSGSYTQIVNKAPTIDPPASSTSVRTGRCDFPDRTLSATAGTYTYRVTVSPGQTVKTDSSVVVETPATPSISCSPTGYVSEGGELTCTCSGDVGRPAGRLQFREPTNTFTPGQYGGNTLPVTLTVNGADNGKTVRCDVDWITDITGQVFTIQVAFPVRSVQLTLNTQTMLLEVAESQSTDVIFECTADFARPSPHLVLSDDQGREVARLTGGSTDVTGQQSVLTHTMRNVRCENSAVYTCTADNGVGRPVYSTATLRVLCGLRIPSDSFYFQEDGVPVLDNSKGQGELHFQILTTATPHTASFLYLGSDDTGPGSQPTPGLLRASNVTKDWTGLYNVTMETENQAVFFIFRLQMQSTHSGGQTSTSNEVPLIVVVAILSVIVVVLLVLNIYQYVKRRRGLPTTAEQPTTHKSVDERAARTETPLAMSPIASGVATDDTGPYEEVRSEIRAVSEAPHTSHTSDTGPYEELKPIDIGLKSVYSAMSPPPHTSGTDGGYENSG
ncbi:uncharacterized protein LOC143277318 isoform X2 [Babylonia areolata]|uniref:uncharacterized protein LOC143277318 isoform X2 n=1 Tax=Babylonia areolata TaxID=304850 RepID=UPI003FD37EBF